MSDTPTTTLTIDGREVTVPVGTGLVEAAEALGIEIPVFCYEPRIGPAVGACRMCLVEIEGMPKLQTACSTGVRDGMNVSTVSDRARDAQEAILEFLLVNHPLDCPVCDKGGECPLQDQAFRWGPGASRFSEIKRNSDKPIPVSPLIALDRERCILCYRCTRFSAEVEQDTQLIPRERGADTVIATFEGRPWEGYFTGNVIELCPVGALTNTEYRFRARPWEAPDHPSVCTGCSVGCGTWNTVREGDVVRVKARENELVDNGWLCDKGRFAYPAGEHEDRLTGPVHRPNRERPVGNRPINDMSHEVAMEWLFDKITAHNNWQPDPELDEEEVQSPPVPELWVLSGNETLEVAFAVQQLAQCTNGSVVAAPGGSAATPGDSATIADLRSAKHILVIGDDDLVDSAPLLDLHVRDAIKAGAHVTIASSGGTRLEHAEGIAAHELVTAGETDDWVSDYCSRMSSMLADMRDSGEQLSEPGVVVYRDGQLSEAAVSALRSTFDLPRAGSGLLAIAATANARGLAALGIQAASWNDIMAHEGGLVLMGCDPSSAMPTAQWAPLAKLSPWVACIDTLPTPMHPVADVVIPGAFGFEQEGTVVNLEGRLQRLTTGGELPAGVRQPLQWMAGMLRRLGGKLPGHAAGAFTYVAKANDGRLPVVSHAGVPTEGILGVTAGPQAQPVAIDGPPEGEGTALYIAEFLYDDNAVAHSERMSFLRDTTKITMSRSDAHAMGVRQGDAVHVHIDDETISAIALTSSLLQSGSARMHAGQPGLSPLLRGWHRAQIHPANAPVHAGGESA